MADSGKSERYEQSEADADGAAAPFHVARARERGTQRPVTLQTLPADTPFPIRDAVRIAALSAMALEHDSITRLYEVAEDAETGELYVASEYVRGITLQERVRRVAPFALPVATEIATQTAEALAFAHRAGVLHGDLRTADVLLGNEGAVKVANFAYVRAAQPGGGPPSVAGDIYAVGALLYEMLTGQTVPAGGELPSVRAVNVGVPPALEGIVQKCLHPDDGVRYRAAATLLLDLQAARDALRSGRSLAWSPLAAARAPRPPAERTQAMAFPPPVSAAAKGAASAAVLAKAEPLMETSLRPPSDERERSSPLGKIVGALFILLIIGVIAVSWYVSKFLAIPNDVAVPNLIGKTMDDARRLGTEQHFTVVEGGSDYSAKWPEDQVYQQDPLPGRTIKAGREVSVFRSLGPRLLTVPDLVGATKDRAAHDLSDTGLPLGTVTEDWNDTVGKGIVTEQDPVKGAQVSRTTAVNLSVSKGPQPPDTPADVQADAPTPDSVVVHWSEVPRAQSYTVYRALDGNSATVARGLVDTRYTDKGLTPDTSYTYTVTASNISGSSAVSEPAIVSTPAKLSTPPVMGDVNVQNPADTSSGDGTDTGSSSSSDNSPARLRQFTIQFRVPRRPRHSRHVQFEVQDVTGTNLVYDETHSPGDTVSAPVQAFGNKITFRIFLDGPGGSPQLVKQQTF